MPEDEYKRDSFDATFSRMEEQLRTISAAQADHATKVDECFDKLGKRIGALEVFNVALKARVAVVAGLFSIAVALGWEFLKSVFASFHSGPPSSH
jgi:hypothetical protein